MATSFTTTTSVVGSVITLGTPVPPGSTGTITYFLLWRFRGTTSYNMQYAKVVGGIVQTRVQLSARPIEFIVRAVDSLGVAYDTPMMTMDLLNSTTEVTYNEAQVPSRGIPGETGRAHNFSFTMQRGVTGPIAAPTRAMTVPLGSSVTAGTATGKVFANNTAYDVNDWGPYQFSYGFGA